jgi:hypothetical protein
VQHAPATLLRAPGASSVKFVDQSIGFRMTLKPIDSTGCVTIAAAFMCVLSVT